MEIKEEELRGLVDDMWKWFSLFGQCGRALMGAMEEHGYEVDVRRMQALRSISNDIMKKLSVVRQRYAAEAKAPDPGSGLQADGVGNG